MRTMRTGCIDDMLRAYIQGREWIECEQRPPKLWDEEVVVEHEDGTRSAGFADNFDWVHGVVRWMPIGYEEMPLRMTYAEEKEESAKSLISKWKEGMNMIGERVEV
jgi:hypothetical protein